MNRFLPFPSSARLLFGTFIIATSASLSFAAEISLVASDTGAVDSFTTGANWSDTTAPSASNIYLTGSNVLFTPNGSTSNFSFAGQSLTINSGGSLIYKGGKTSNIITVSSLILNGGTLGSVPTNSTSEYHLAGNLNVAANGGTLDSGSNPFGISLDSALSGSGSLTVSTAASSGSVITVTSGSNTFSGNISLQNNGKLALACTGNLNFVIGTDGINNGISGTGNQPLTLDGTFVFDLSEASANIGSTWNIVDVDSLDESFGPTFAVSGFADNGDGVWSSGNYQFSETTGALTVVPEPSAIFLLSAGLSTLLCRRPRRAVRPTRPSPSACATSYANR